MTAAEFKNAVREGKTPNFRDVDLVTCATCAVISGISAVMTIPAVGGADYRDCTSISLNGIECILGTVNDDGSMEVTVEAAAVSPDRTSETIPKNYCTGDLLRDIAEGKEIEIAVNGKDGILEDIIFPEDIVSARLYACIGAGENGCALVNGGEKPLKNEHLFQPLGADFSEAFVYGCGEITPFVNDPDLRSMRAGTKILVNGIIGTITAINDGEDSEGVFAGVKVGGPSLSVSADIKEMMPEFMGGLATKSGRESVIAVAVAIPVIDSESMAALSVPDKDIPLPVIDLDKSVHVGDAGYDAVWQDADRSIEVNPLNCLYCGGCPAGSLCPRKAVILGGGIIQSRCISCGRCLNTCPGEVYSMNPGSITIKKGCKEGIKEGIIEGMNIPIKLRLSDRRRAEELCEILKEMIEDGEFSID